MTAEEVRALAGIYVDRNTNDVFRLDAAGDRLRGDGNELVPVGAARFRDVRRQTDVTLRRIGSKVLLEYADPNAPSVRLERVDTLTPSASVFGAYAGTYWSPELDVRYTIAVDSGKLVVKRALMPALTLDPMYADAFMNGGNWVFTRDASGMVNGMLYSQGRVRRVRFARLD